jgi:hypothetical protein
MSDKAKINKHLFHAFYVFEYGLNQNYGGAAVGNLYADWPIINRVPIGARIPGEGSKPKKFSSITDVRKWIERKSDIKNEDFCENFIRIPFNEFHKYRQLFHGMLKTLDIEYNANFSLSAQSEGVPSPARSAGVSATNSESVPCPTDKDGNTDREACEKRGCVVFSNGVGQKIMIPGMYSCGGNVNDRGTVAGETIEATTHSCFGPNSKTFEKNFSACERITCDAGSAIAGASCSASCSLIDAP